MAQESGIYNALGWAHLQLRGGWKNLAITTTGYALLMAILMVSTVRLNPPASSSIMWGWTVGLLGLQAGVLLLFGCITVSAAVRTDHASRMIESHRIMPTSAAMAVLGYIFGSPCQAMAMSVANFVLGAIAASGAQVAFARWAMANLVLISFAMFVWVLVVFFGFMAQTAFRWIVSVLVIGFWISQGNIILLLPGITVLASPIIGNSIFSMRTSTATLSWEYMASGAAFLIAAILFTAAARKYRSAETPAFGYDLGLVFLAAFVGLSMLGLRYWDYFEPAWPRYYAADTHLRFVVSILATMMVALIPVTGAARAEIRYNRRLRIDDVPARLRRPVAPGIITVLAATIPLLLLNVEPDAFLGLPHVSGGTALVVISFVVSMSFLIRIIEGDGRRVWMIPTAFIVVTWIGPVLADLMYHGLAVESERTTGIISTFSPAGALFEIWNARDTRINTNFGLGFQATLAMIMAIIFYARRAMRARQLR